MNTLIIISIISGIMSIIAFICLVISGFYIFAPDVEVDCIDKELRTWKSRMDASTRNLEELEKMKQYWPWTDIRLSNEVKDNGKK